MRRFDYPQIDSTNKQAQRLLKQHPGQVLLVTAVEQTAGRGRRGRTWQSPRGGAWMSLVWPMPLAPDRYDAAPLIAALATWRTIRDMLDNAPPDVVNALKIKWPNDLLLAGQKAAGILCQRVLPTGNADPGTPVTSGTSGGSGGSGGASLIIGVGINVDFDPSDLQGELRRPATTLRQASGLEINVDTVIDRFAATAVNLMGQFEQHGLTPAMLTELNANLALVLC